MFMVTGGWSPAVTGLEVWYTLDLSPVNHRADNLTHTFFIFFFQVIK